ncbi:acetyltransferase [Virgibacillus flavescens]|uniref:acetyltransferase n=1 Tax=Virgibacillus flavescens TaxID=1611422 RepID=UPI003D326E41
MQDIYIYGSGGFAREVAMLIERINKTDKPTWNILGFIDDDVTKRGEIINGYQVVGNSEVLKGYQLIYVVLGVGSPAAKESIIHNLSTFEHVVFPNIIHPGVDLHKTNKLGKGNILCAGTVITCNIEMKDFVTVNISTTIGHDVTLHSYSTISPNSSISGNVVLKNGVDCGTNATIIQGKVIGKHTIIGAGATVVKDLPANCTAVGSPAKPIKFHTEN